MTLMKTSNEGIALIKQFEGCKLNAYLDSVGVATIGYGHTQGVKLGMNITQAQAETYLQADIKPVETLLNAMGINFKQCQFDALAAWIFNLGGTNFANSTLKKKIIGRASDIEIADQMVRWVNAGGKPLLGLKRRRVAEANMFLGRECYRINNKEEIVRQ